MITCPLAVCAERVIRDAEWGAVSVIHMLDIFQVVNFPIVAKMTCLLIFDRSDEDPEHQEARLFFSLGEEIILDEEIEFDFADSKRHRHVILIEGLVISRPGTLTMVVESAGNRMNAWPMVVWQVGKPQLRLPLEETGTPSESGGRTPA